MEDTPNKQRRQRAILSCNDCRRRKLRCDRLDPCDRCIRGGIAHSCAYGPNAHNAASEEPLPRKRQRHSTRPTSSIAAEKIYTSESRGDVFNRAENVHSGNLTKTRPDLLQHDVAHLKQPISGHEQEPKDQVEFLARSPDLKEISRPTAVMGMMKGRSYGTVFYGSSSTMSVIAHFPDLRLFMKEAFSNSTARRLSQDIKAMEDRARSMQPHNRILSVSSLRTLLPDQATVDVLLQTYFATFETTFRIIHIPSFKEAYEGYWETQDTEDTEMDAIILAILACTICTTTHESPRYNHTGSNFHTKAAIWIKACAAWLKRQSNKHRSLASLQVRCLRLLALSTASLKVKEYYQEVQAHVALMRSGGMHRDPSIFMTRCSAFEGEMRRRLWAMTVELELQASIEKGTSSMLSNLDYDCASPRNINDIDLLADLEELPQSKPVTVFTDTSFLHLSMQTFETRTRLCASVNNLKGAPQFNDILQQEDLIQRCLRDIQHWTDPRSVQVQVLLDLQLRQFLVVLYASRALKVESRTQSSGRYSMIMSLEAAATTIELHSKVMQESNALILTRNDYFRASLLICHVAYYARAAKDSIMMRLAKTVFDESMDKALCLQEKRAMQSGRGSEYFWYVSAAVSLVGLQFDPSKSESMKRQAVNRVAKLLYRVLSLQDEPSEWTLASEVVLGHASNTAVHINAALDTSAEPLTAETFTNAGLRLDAFDLGETPEWMDDFFFFHDVPPFDLNYPFYPAL